MNIEKRDKHIFIECPQCKITVAVAPVFHTFNNTRYEAWAKFWFKQGRTGRGLCEIIYQGKEYAPSTAASKITGYQVNGWGWWKDGGS